jgi:hypothetical protein
VYVLSLKLTFTQLVVPLLVTGPSGLVYIFIENQQMHQNDHFIVLSSETFLHVSAYERHHHGAPTILTSYVGVHYRKRNGMSSETAPVSCGRIHSF